MRIGYVLIFSFLLFAACKSKQADNSISVDVKYTEEYCGGTEPTEQMIQDLETPKPYTGIIYLHQDNDPFRKNEGIKVNIANGQAKLLGIPTGCYLGFTTSKELENSEEIPAELLECYKETNSIPQFMWTIFDDTRSLEALVIKRCDPCSPPMP